LDVIAHLGEFGRGADKIWDRARIAIPNEDMEPAFPKVLSDPASDDAEAEHPYVFPDSTRHVKAGHSVGLAAYSACGENCRRAIQNFTRVAARFT
jgi:hypothetical protein